VGCLKLTYECDSELRIVHGRKELTSKNSVENLRSSYLFGFQGQEKDDEIKGNGNSINYKYRMYDPRIGRFFSIDPLTPDYPEYSPYHFSSNQPIHARELEGLESSFDLNRNNPGLNSINATSSERKTYSDRVVVTAAIGVASAALVFAAIEVAPIVTPHLARGLLQMQAAGETGVGFVASNPEVAGGIIGFGIGLTPNGDSGLEVPFSGQPSFEAGKATGEIISNFEYLQG